MNEETNIQQGKLLQGNWANWNINDGKKITENKELGEQEHKDDPRDVTNSYQT